LLQRQLQDALVSPHVTEIGGQRALAGGIQARR
jgi:hypothetical protein